MLLITAFSISFEDMAQLLVYPLVVRYWTNREIWLRTTYCPPISFGAMVAGSSLIFFWCKGFRCTGKEAMELESLKEYVCVKSTSCSSG